MRSISYTITADDKGKRVDHYLIRERGLSRRVVTTLKQLPEGLLLNGSHTRTVDILHTGDVLTVNLPEQDKRIPLCDTYVEVLYNDEDVIVYNKPTDMPVHQSGGHIYGTLDGVYASYCQDKFGRPASMRAINRLDKDTTGAVVIAHNQIAAGIMWKTVDKRYVAVLEGMLPQQQGTVDLPIEREFPMEQRRIVTPEGQRSVTHYRVLAVGNGHSLVEFTLETGRTHQIRVHMSHIGCPLVGDSFYGHPSELIARQALHCRTVRFPHPMSGVLVEVVAPYPQDFSALLTVVGIDEVAIV